MEELKLCPFCGELPIVDHITDSIFGSGLSLYWVACPKCGIRTQKDRNKVKIIEVWNRRVSDDAGRSD